MRIIRLEAPTGLTLRLYPTPNTIEVASTEPFLVLVEVSPRVYEVEVIQDSLLGIYQVAIEMVDDAITAYIDAGYVVLEVDDGAHQVTNTITTTPQESPGPDTPTGEFSSYGPKRVKTREMEIEQFDPEKLERIERRKTATAPTFCESQICLGIPAGTRKWYEQR